MISSLHGTAAHVADDSLVIVVGGVGFTVAVTSQFARTIHVGDDVHVHTNLIVREDALSLYGFESREELTVFTQLISVTGVGPKSALGVLSSLTVPIFSPATSKTFASKRLLTEVGSITVVPFVLVSCWWGGELSAPGRCGRRGGGSACPTGRRGSLRPD